MTFSIVPKRNIWLGFSAILIAASVISLILWGLRFGIDFTGGSLIELRFDEAPAISDVRSFLNEHDYSGSVQQSEQGLLVRTRTLNELEHAQLAEELAATIGPFEELRFDSVGPTIGNELRKNAIIGSVVTLALIGLYIAWAFRKVSQPVSAWKYGLLTIGAAFHDVIVTIGAFSVFGHFYGWEIGTAFVAAILTILGYSINDTVVVFDRTRENLAHAGTENFAQTVEKSIQQTFARSVATSFTTLLALIAIFLFGGDTTQPFALALIIGIAVGTYSSIFIASPALVTWQLRR